MTCIDEQRRISNGHAVAKCRCKECLRMREVRRLSYPGRRDKVRDEQLKLRYGITLEIYKQMLDDQGDVCAICFLECTTGRQLAVDHNKETKQVRSLLCSNCNNGLGRFNEDPELLKRAIDYIEKWRRND